ncbi:MAG: hypothetical protein U0325_30325 [Polyangiales bacterium]
MSGDPNAPPNDPALPTALEVPRAAVPPPTMPGIPSMMPSAMQFAHVIAPMPLAAPVAAPAPAPMPMMPFAAPLPPTFAAPAPAAAPAVPVAPVAPIAPPVGPVLGVRDFYQFGEEPVGQRVQVTILETPAMPPELPPPSKIDPGLEATRVALEAQLARNAIAALPYVPPTATRWFRFSPLELFMEQVLARRLWTVE